MLKMLRGKRLIFVGDSNIWESQDFKCSINFIKSPFLVQEWKFSNKAGERRETLWLDTIHGSLTKYHDDDIIIFNTGHWWTHHKTHKV
ncbi:hypothetical protein CQW23_01778 [Capsicum baccatum]|uniref:Trichome birefringence-like C-terminal domain-containing protein n=1 Tax=Capsicum baccatum TaxID=33114 RepID=A0A2G2XPJ4_CAPBA|nr:hypothetical protein CQW23_01778 [Capsicum baccatum]